MGLKCHAACLVFQLIQQRLSLLKVCCLKSLGEPLVYRHQQIVGIMSLALGLPKSNETSPE